MSGQAAVMEWNGAGEPKTDLAMVEELWGPPPWELHFSQFYPPEVMERVRAVTIDGVRFVRRREPGWDAECEAG